MIKFALNTLLILILISPIVTFSQEVKVYKTFEEFGEVLNRESDKVHIINFWATWCKPCVAELPYFEELGRILKDDVDITLVSLDFGTQLESRVIPFVKAKALESEVVLLDDPKSNIWIDLVEKSWSGAIPATLIRNSEKSEFYEKEFHSTDELKDIILTFLK